MYEEDENKSKQHSISIDRFKMIQWAKNPISSCNLVLISLFYMFALIIAFPLSYYGVQKDDCDLEVNYRYHLIFLVVIFFVLLPTDVYALIFKERVEEIVSNDIYHSTTL